MSLESGPILINQGGWLFWFWGGVISKMDRFERGKVELKMLEVLVGNGNLEGRLRRGFLGTEECHDEQTERKRS